MLGSRVHGIPRLEFRVMPERRHAMKRSPALTLAIAGIGIVAVLLVALGVGAPAKPSAIAPAWSEAKWPFLLDQWGIGRAFTCAPADCGGKVEVYVRPKIGFCNCSTGVSDDAELERVADTELLAAAIQPLGPGRAVKVGWMHGLSRLYRPSDEKAAARLLSVAFNDECDVVVAVAKLAGGDPAATAPAVIAFLNSNSMVLWAKKELGLEFVRREW
jgi:hypothetical protein